MSGTVIAPVSLFEREYAAGDNENHLVGQSGDALVEPAEFVLETPAGDGRWDDAPAHFVGHRHDVSRRALPRCSEPVDLGREFSSGRAGPPPIVVPCGAPVHDPG